MKKQIVTTALLVMALLLGPGLSQARNYNAYTGRFQTMDTYEGSPQDPPSLHKYVYCHADPVNNSDPSGMVTLPELMSSTGNMVMLAGRVTVAALNTYSRITTVVDAVNDVSMVASIVGDGTVDDGESEILSELVGDHVRSRLQGYALRLAAGGAGKVLGGAAAQVGRLQISKAAIQKTRDWYRNHRAKWAGKTSGNPNYPVQYDAYGWPEFSPYLRQGGVNTVQIKLTGSRNADFDLADNAAGISAAWRQANDMFQNGAYVGGFAGTEMAFCFSVYEAGKECWFQLSLDEMKDVAEGRKSVVEISPAG